MLLLVFGGRLQWLPTSGIKTAGSDATGLAVAMDVARHMVLPVITMVAVTYASTSSSCARRCSGDAQPTTSSTARAKGLHEDLVRTSSCAYPTRCCPP